MLASLLMITEEVKTEEVPLKYLRCQAHSQLQGSKLMLKTATKAFLIEDESLIVYPPAAIRSPDEELTSILVKYTL